MTGCFRKAGSFWTAPADLDLAGPAGACVPSGRVPFAFVVAAPLTVHPDGRLYTLDRAYGGVALDLASLAPA